MDEFMQTAAPSDEAIDLAWEEELGSETEANRQDPEPEADWPLEQELPAEKAAKDVKQLKGQPKPDAEAGKPPKADQPLTFTLKHLDEVRTVDRNEVVKLAQQGMDYDRVRAERDQLRSYREQADPAMTLIRSYAENNGMSVPEYIDLVRKQELLRSGVSKQTASAQIAAEKSLSPLRVQEQANAQAEMHLRVQEQKRKEQAEVRKASMSRFLKAYPTIRAEEIPKGVWESVAKGEDLTTAYALHKNSLLETELAAERQNKRNAQKSTGSMTTKGAGILDEIDKWWNEE